jgi:hypothetical protein
MLIVLLSFGCATRPTPPRILFSGHPQYPVTVIPVSPALLLRHLAGPPCAYNSKERPEIGSENTRTYSTYELTDRKGMVIFKAPSMLSDPRDELAEFQSYYRQNDQITVLCSSGENSILIIEDRSPAGPNEAHILLRRINTNWAWSQIPVPLLPQNSSDIPPPNRSYPGVVGLSDTRIWFCGQGKTWSQKLDSIERIGSPSLAP